MKTIRQIIPTFLLCLALWAPARGVDFWMDVDAAIAEAPVNLSPLLDDTDFKSIEDDVNYNATGLALIWHFVTTAGAYSQTAVTPTDTGGVYDWIEQGVGYFTIEIPASGGGTINNDTEGFGWFSGVATGVMPWRGPVIGFRSVNKNDLEIDDGTAQTNQDDFFDGTGYVGGTQKSGVDFDDSDGTVADAQLDFTSATVWTNLVATFDTYYATVFNGTLHIWNVNVDTWEGTDVPDTLDSAADVVTGMASGSVASVTGAVGSVTGNVGGNVVGSVASVTGAVGSVTGAVGSVTGAVGSVTGNVGGNVVGSVASVTGAVGSVTGNVGGNVTGSVGSLVGHTVQTGDSYALANGASGFVAIKNQAAAIETDTQDLQTQVGTDGAGLTAIGDTRLAYLDAAVSGCLGPASVVDGAVTVDDLLECLLTFMLGKATVTDNGATSDISFYKQDGSTIQYTITSTDIDGSRSAAGTIDP